MGLRKKLGIALVVALLSLFPARASAATVGDVSQELMCQCGCGLVLANCTHTDCSAGGAMTALIEQRLAQGESEEEILAFFVAQYGEQVLATLPKSGFNLMAWLLPLVGLLFGGGVVYFVLKRGLGRGRQPPVGISAAAEEDDKYRGQLEKELEEFDEGGFR